MSQLVQSRAKDTVQTAHCAMDSQAKMMGRVSSLLWMHTWPNFLRNWFLLTWSAKRQMQFVHLQGIASSQRRRFAILFTLPSCCNAPFPKIPQYHLSLVYYLVCYFQAENQQPSGSDSEESLKLVMSDTSEDFKMKVDTETKVGTKFP